MIRFSLSEETLGYVTASDPINSDRRLLVAGSQNVLIERNRKVRSGNGYTRLGAANSASTPIRNEWTWNTSTGTELLQRFYDDELEVWIAALDGETKNTWYRVRSGWSTTQPLRAATWWDDTENLDFQIMVNGDDDLYRWNGAVAVAASTTVNTITKKGTQTWAQNRFYVNGNKTLINTRTGTEFVYTGGESTTTLTGITTDPTSDIQDGDVLVQKVVTNSNSPAANRNNHTIHSHENQLVVGSLDANEVYISSNTSYTTYTFSSPRVSGEGALLTLDGPSRGLGSVGAILVAFAGEHSVFRAEYEQITVGSTLAETLKVKKISTAPGQGSSGADTVVNLGNAIAYVSNEPALRYLQDPTELEGLSPRTLSNPIKPDFDDEDFSNAHAQWWKNRILISAPVNSKLYMLEFVEDPDGNLRRYWHPPQILPVRSMAVFDSDLYAGSNGAAETYRLFDGFSGVNSADEKLPLQCIARFAYQSFGKRDALKSFDLFHVEGEISPQTNDLTLRLRYNFNGIIQVVERTVSGQDLGILLGVLPADSLGQQSLGQNPLGGSLTVPADAEKFRVVFEMAREDFHEIQTEFETNEIDRYFAITAYGPNARISARRPVDIYR